MRPLLPALLALLLPAQRAFAQGAPVPTGKLPDAATPIDYRLDFTIVPEKERFSGHAEIDIDLKQPAASLYMHAGDLHVTGAVVSAAGQDAPVTLHAGDPARTRADRFRA